jgi:hypothetical protein
VRPLPPDIRTVEDLTPEPLGATAPELAAFRVAAVQVDLDLGVTERTAILLRYGDGTDWRERVTDLVPVRWGLVTGEIDLPPGGGR